jgi:hypothetical protein
MKLLGKHPVIKADFKICSGKKYEEVLAGVKDGLASTFSKHEYLLQSKKLSKR